MFTYILRRLVQSIFVLFIVIVITFTLPYFEPQGILSSAYAALGTQSKRSAIHAFALQHGFYQSYPVRLWQYIDQVFIHFNFGQSYVQVQ